MMRKRLAILWVLQVFEASVQAQDGLIAFDICVEDHEQDEPREQEILRELRAAFASATITQAEPCVDVDRIVLNGEHVEFVLRGRSFSEVIDNDSTYAIRVAEVYRALQADLGRAAPSPTPTNQPSVSTETTTIVHAPRWHVTLALMPELFLSGISSGVHLEGRVGARLELEPRLHAELGITWLSHAPSTPILRRAEGSISMSNVRAGFYTDLVFRLHSTQETALESFVGVTCQASYLWTDGTAANGFLGAHDDTFTFTPSLRVGAEYRLFDLLSLFASAELGLFVPETNFQIVNATVASFGRGFGNVSFGVAALF